MSYRAKNRNLGVNQVQRDNALRCKLDRWVVGNLNYTFERVHDVVYINGEETSFEISGIVSDVIFENFPEYRFGVVKDFTLLNCKMVSLIGFPEEIKGNLYLEGCTRKFSEENKEKYLPNEIVGDVTIVSCPYLSKNDFYDNSTVIGHIKDDKDNARVVDSANSSLTDGQQQIIDFAESLGEDVFSTNELNSLEDFFYGQNE